MVVTTGPQLNDTWLNWKSFHYPAASGSKWAYSVPTEAAKQINSGYSLMIDMVATQFWMLVIGLYIFMILQKKKVNDHAFKDLMPQLWNGRSDLMGAVVSKIQAMARKTDEDGSNQGGRGRIVPIPLILFAVVALYCGQKAMSILASARVIIDNTAPVNPDAIYVPDGTDLSFSMVAARYVLNAPWAMRALGTATASIASLSKYVSVSKAIPTGTYNATQTQETIENITYSYQVTGADMGLQKYPNLVLSVKGSCFTEYNWYVSPGFIDNDTNLGADVYYPFGDASLVFKASALTGMAPMAVFVPGLIGQPGTLNNSTATWAALISSVGKSSYSPGTDPWYLTELQSANDSSSTGAAYVVASGRPALSCWEDDVWSYGGKNATVTNLDTLPGLHLSDGMKDILAMYLGVPMVVTMSVNLGSSALLSGLLSLGTIIDASTNSFAQDLERLIVAAYVATTNVLTATTLFPYGASTKVTNKVRSTSGQVKPGVEDFVVWTTEATALDMVVVLTIPILLVVLFLLNLALFNITPMSKVKLLDAVELFGQFMRQCPNADINYQNGKPNWALG